MAFGVTAVCGLVVKKLGWKLPDTVGPVAWALIIGGGWMMLAEFVAARRAARLNPWGLPDGQWEQSAGRYATGPAITWTIAILVGLAQVVAGVFPGTSRSAATIFIALLAGVGSRVVATEFAFLVGIPTMFAATAFELLGTLKGGGSDVEDWGALGIASLASAITAFVSVKWLLHYIQSHRFTAFAIYRIALGAALLLLVPAGQ